MKEYNQLEINLYKAIASNDIDKVREILHDSEVHKKFERALLVASSLHRGEITKLLLNSVNCGFKKDIQKNLIISGVTGDLAQTKSLLEKGANLHESEWKSIFPYWYFSGFFSKSGEMTNLLLTNGLEPILVRKFFDETIKSVIRKFLKYKFDKGVPTENIGSIKALLKDHEYVEKCLSELQKLASSKFHKSCSYYDLLNMGEKNINKLAHLMKNKEFVNKLEENYPNIVCYDSDLKRIVQDASKLRDEMANVKSILSDLFSECLPDVVIRELAKNFTIEDLPME